MRRTTPLLVIEDLGFEAAVVSMSYHISKFGLCDGTFYDHNSSLDAYPFFILFCMYTVSIHHHL